MRACVTVCACLRTGVSSVWWPLLEGAGSAVVDSGSWGLYAGALSPSLTWYRGSLRFARASDFVVSTDFLPDPLFTRDFQVRPWAGMCRGADVGASGLMLAWRRDVVCVWGGGGGVEKGLGWR
jgi:hypothetical protein